MSERRVRALFAAALSAACWMSSATVGAQTPDADVRRGMSEMTRDELSARIDSLRDEYRRQYDVVKQMDSMRRERARQVITDTVAVGPFLVVERRGTVIERTVDAVRDAWRDYAPLVGLAAERLNGTIVTQSLPSGFAGEQSDVRMYRIEPRATGRVDYPSAADRVMRNVLTDALPEDAGVWLRGSGVDMDDGFDWAYRALATSHSVTAHDCYDGNVSACVSTLALGDSSRDAATWYTPAQLRDMIAGKYRTQSPGYEECVEDGNHARCLEIIRERGAVPPPVGAGVRGTLLTHALRLGGEGAYERFVADAPDIQARIANAAGRPIDEVIVSWHTAVMEARPDMQAGMVRAGFWTVVWLAGLGLLAMRSTRWRLG